MIWSDLFNRVLPHLPGCPEPIVEDAMRETAIMFCRESEVWEEEIHSLYPVAGIDRYQLKLPDETKLVSLACAEQKLLEDDPVIEHWPAVNVFGLLHFTTLPEPEKGPLKIRAILSPSDDATGMPDRIGLDYDTALIHGTIARLQAMPKKDWSSPSTIAYHYEMYRNRLTDARVDRATNHTKAPIRVAPQPLF